MRRGERQIKLDGCGLQALVERPQSGVGGQLGRGEQVRIDIADAYAVQCGVGDEAEHFSIGRHGGGGQVLQEFENAGALFQTAKRQFAKNERMTEDLTF